MTSASSSAYSDETYTKVYDFLLYSEIYRMYRRSYERLTGHTVALIHKRVAETPHQEMDRCKNAYCSTLLNTGSCYVRCQDHINLLAEGAFQKSNSATCMGQITTSLIPIKVKDTVVAYLKAGQIKLKDRNCDRTVIDKFSQCLPEQTVEHLLKSFENLQEVALDTYTDQLVVIGAFSMQLSEIAERILNGKKEESLLTEKCKSYINSHLSEKICLDQMASYTGVTNSHMCKQFHTARHFFRG